MPKKHAFCMTCMHIMLLLICGRIIKPYINVLSAVSIRIAGMLVSSIIFFVVFFVIFFMFF